MRIAVYPGSFDPITVGHLDLVERAARIFDEVILCVSMNGEKRSMFTPEQRLAMARRHARLLESHDPRQVVRMRRHACWYVKGLPGASAARGKLTRCTTAEDFEAVFDELEARQQEH